MRSSERGSAMLVTLILITALLAGAASLTSMQHASTRGAAMVRMKSKALACAEAGLATARTTVFASYRSWNAALAAGTQPSWLASLPRDLDGDNVADFELTLRDNADETATDDPTHDNDLAIYIVSSCVKYPETPIKVAELVRYAGGGTCYQSQLGGCGGNANAN